jgi:hypothetical protein
VLLGDVSGPEQQIHADFHVRSEGGRFTQAIFRQRFSARCPSPTSSIKTGIEKNGRQNEQFF